MDASGNVYTTGLFLGTADFDPGAGESTLTSSGSEDVFITKLNSSGGLVWAKKVGGTSSDKGLSIVVDASSNVYVSGTFGGIVDFDPGAGTSNMTATSSTDLYVLKLDASGNYAWAKRWGSNLGVTPIGLAVDASGNVYTGGSFVNIVDLDPGAGTVNVNTGLSNVTHTFLVKLNASGNYVIGKRLGVTNYGIVNSSAMEMDASNNIILTGIFGNLNSGVNGTNVDFDPDAGVSELDAANGAYFIAKYNSSLSYVWAVHSPSVQNTTAMHIDGSGNLLVTGYFAGAKDFDPGVGETNLTPVGNEDAYVFKLNSLGEFQWAKNFGSTLSDYGYAVTSDAVGNVYVTGVFWGTTVNDFDPGPAVVALPTGTNGYDGFIVKLNASGDYQWAKSIYAPFVNGWDQVNGIFLDGSNNIYCTGFFTNGTVDFDPGAGADNKTSTGSDAFVLKWSQSALIAQTITFNPLLSKAMGDAPFALTATASSGLQVSYTSSNTGVATVSGNTVTLVAPGTTTITASQPGNGTYSPASNVNQLLTVTAAADVTPPSILSYSPSDNSTNVTIGANLVATFSETVTAVTSKVVSIKYAGGEVPDAIFESYTLPSANVTISGNSVTINPTSNLVNLAEYYVNIESGAFVDAAGNPFAGISNATTWNFTAVPASAPVATAFYPVNNATNIPVGVNSFTLVFDDFAQVNQSALGTVQLKKLDGTVVFETTAPNISTCCQNVPFYMGEAILEPATTYYFNIGNDIFRKPGGVSYYAGISNNTDWRFTTGSVNSVISSYLPARGATSVSTSLGSIKMYFSNEVYDSYGYYRLRKASDNSLVKQWDVYADVTYGYDAQAGLYFAELPLSAALEAGTSYYVDNQFNNAGGYEPGWMEYDFAYNEPEDIWTTARIVPWATNFWTFTTTPAADITPPTITSLSPADGATGVAVASNLVATFSENVTAVTSKVVSIKYAGGEVPGAIFESYTLPSANVTISGNTVTVNPTSNLANLGEYYVNIEAGAFIDVAGNSFAGISNATTWNFTAVPASAPVATAFYPVNNATDVPVGVTRFNIVFDDFTYVNESAVGTVQLKKLDGTVVLENTAMNMGSGYQNVTFDMGEAVLEPATTYYFNIGNDVFRKSGGISYYSGIANNTSWRFTTGSVNSVISSYLPARGATSVSTALGSIKMYFSNEVYDSYGYYRLRKASDNSLVKQWDVYADVTYGYDAQAGLYFAELPLSATLEAGTTYYVDNQFNNAGGYEPGWMEYDFAYNEPEDIWTTVRIVPWATTHWIFTTEQDITAPQVEVLSPSNLGVQVAIDANLVITFDKAIAINNSSAQVQIYKKSDNSLFAEYTMGSAQVNISGNTLTVNPTTDFAYETIYYVLLDANAIQDIGGNLFTGISAQGTWQFHTTKPAGSENEAPYIVFFEPEHLTEEYPLDGKVTAHFNEPIRMPFLRVFSLSSDDKNTYSKSFSIGAAGSTSIISGNKLIINNAAFPYLATGVHMVLPANTVWNDPGSGNAAINTKDSDTWLISTSTQFDPGAPPLTLNVIEYPANDATGVYWSAGTYSFTMSPDLAGNESFSVYKNTTGGIRIKKLSNDQVVAEYTGAEVRDFLNTGPFGTSLYFATELEPSTTYYITIDDDVIYNTITGSFFEGIQDNTTWRFTTESVANYESRFASFSPSRGAVDVDSELSEIQLFFNEEAFFGSGAPLRLRKAGSNEIIKEWESESPDFSKVNNLQYTFTGFSLEPETTYYIENVFQNDQYPFSLSADYMGGWSNDFWTFTTGEGPDETPPGVVSFSPANNATEVSLATTSISITFNEEIKIAASGSTKQAIIWWTPEGESLTNTTVDLENESAFTISGNTLVMNYDGWLPGLTYYVTLADGVIADLANNWFGGWTGSATWSFTTEKANQTITFNELPARTLQQGNFTLEATTSSSLDVSYSSSNPSVATVSGNTVTVVGTGTTTITASQAGNNNYNAALPVERTLFVTDATKTNQSITFNTLAERAFGSGTFQLEASASSGLAVSYSSSNTAVAMISGSTVTLIGVGETTIAVTQNGNDTYNPAPEKQQVLTVVKGSQTITFDAIADKSFGDAAFTLSPTASSSLSVSLGVVSGSVTLNSNQVTITGAGTATIRATQTGNENFNAATPVERSFTIAKKAQVITIGELADRLTTDPAFDVVASVDSDLALSYSIDGPATLSGATVTLTGEEGTVTITVSQGGNENYLAADAATTFEVTAPEVAEKQEQTITFAAIADKTFGDAAFALEATATSELAVSFEVVSGPVTLAGNTISITGAGSATIRATQAGNEAFKPATPVERSFVIAKKGQIVTIERIGDKLTTDGPFVVIASTISGLALGYSVVGPATLSGTTLTLTGAEGTVTITVIQAGNDNYLSAEATETFEVTAPVVKALSISGVASLGNSAFTQGEAKLHPKNNDGSFATALVSALSANGAFTFDDVPAGQYALSIASASTAVLTTYFEKATTLANATLLTLSAESIEGIVVDMIEKPSVPGGPGSIAGKLLLSGDGSRHLVTDGRTMEGTPLSGVTILLVSSPGGELIASTVTASDGSFGFSNLPLGAYKLLIDYEGNVSLESPEITISTGQLSFEVASEVTDEGIVIIAMPTATTGVSAEVLRSMIKTYPNPSQGQFTIAWDGSLADVKEIIIHNNNGSAVWQHSMTTAQLTVDISSQPAGVYILRLITSHGAAVHKLVIK
ncbi:Ig-like domain-containing protein [Imperialibacter sp. 75]|uniref:Ig-like domain-containing protein n=1 Tax=Imperialibacter sp. 75 TaxID=2768855 RepID=UPI00191AB568|nr:Ig-like domain-containing protein [Imperialibacter sp. 75]